MAKTFLDKVYDVRSPDEVRDLYDQWSDSYEAEVADNGYATPGRTAQALADIVEDKTKPILDFGCGTGLSGLALKLSGFEHVHGLDLSADMLALAHDKGIYDSLSQVDADAPLPVAPGQYQTITAIGVIGAGAAAIEVFDTLMTLLPTGGRLGFSFNDHALADPVYEGRVNNWIDAGKATMLFKEYGDHLPGLGLNSNVYVIEKT